MARRLKWLTPGDPEPTPAQWAAMGQGLRDGDPLAYALVAWMESVGMRQGWARLEAALAQGPETWRGHPTSAEAPPALRAYLEQVWSTPSWLEPERLARGAEVLQYTGLHGMMVLRDAGLMAGYQASAINQALLMTGSLHRGAQRRVAETTAWWLACTGDGGMSIGAPGFMSTVRVRVMHALVRARLSHHPDWNEEAWGLPINQVDMQATYLAFGVVQLLSLRTTGVLMRQRDADAVMHLWRYIGWLMGVEERWLCDDEATGRVLLYQNLLSQAPADDSSVQLGRALADEPLHRLYPWGAAWRGRFNRARHLSLVRWFVGGDGMRRLGLRPVWPWYPMLMALPLAVGSGLGLLWPPLGRAWRRVARARQQAYLTVLMGEAKAPHAGPVEAAR